MANLGSQHQEWREKNPLRLWRKEQGLSMMNAAQVIGCGVSTLQSWEYGSTAPDLERIAKPMGIKASALKARFDRWNAKSPEAK